VKFAPPSAKIDCKLRARLYNALLQGQFRDSDLEYSYGDMRPLIGEACAGVTA